MGVKFGEIDSNQILTNEFRIGVLEKIVNWLLTNASIATSNELDIETIQKSVINDLKKKYPKSGIEYKGGS